jgi:hypothetical protein
MSSARKRRKAGEIAHDTPARPRPKGTPRVCDHESLWTAIRDLSGKVNYALGALAVLLPLTLATFAAVVLR